MESWSNPATRSLKGSDKIRPRKSSRSKDDWDLMTRTSWRDAKIALSQVVKGKANGNKPALWIRSHLQLHLYQLGCFIQIHAGKVLFVGLLILSTFCVGLKSATVQIDIEKLWVEEGGRLEKELNYISKTLGDGVWNNDQIILQLPKPDGNNVLNVDALLTHLDTVLAATRVHVEMFDTVWKLKDICVTPSYPSFDDGFLEQIFEKLMPCAIITPLDCFWEGSKIAGPEFPISIPEFDSVQWTNLNPLSLLKMMKLTFSSTFDSIEAFMKRVGVSSAYQEKPCLNPQDPQCPHTAPNKLSLQLPDVAHELNGGCKGIAARYMHWPEELIVGGATKNKSGNLVKAHAIQTVIPLMGEKEMYELWSDNYKVHNSDWSVEKARMIIEAWQRKFTLEMQNHVNNKSFSKHYQILPFTTTSLLDIVKDFSQLNVTRIALGYVLMLVYSCVCLLKWNDFVNSQSGIGIAGVLLVAMSVASGLGFCSIVGIVFNASTTQIVPFLALGLGVDDLFILTHTYAENVSNQIPVQEETGECLKQSGVSILLTSVINLLAFLAAAIIPIPALRSFAFQIAVLLVFNVASLLLIFPAIVSLDLRRRESKRIDIFCCFTASHPLNRDLEKGVTNPTSTPCFGNQVFPAQAIKLQTVTRATPAPSDQPQNIATTLASNECWPVSTAPSVESLMTTSTSMRELVGGKKSSLKERCLGGCIDPPCHFWSLTCFARDFYGPFLQKTPVKMLTVVVFLALLGVSVWGMVKVSDGLDLTDLVPHDTKEYSFLRAQKEYFGFYNMFVVTQGNFEYPTNQELLQQFHDSFVRIDKVVKNDDGGLPEFWLSMFRNWLKELQEAFDDDWNNGCISQEWWFKNASSDAILAYKLLVQTGQVDNPVDKSLVTKVRLVNENGIINPKAFYNYLTAWVSNDPLVYAASMANFRPEPKPWVHDPRDFELKIAKSQPLIYTQLPFYLNKLSSTDDVTSSIKQVRDNCKKYEEQGLANFPTGIPFVFWEQYLSIRFYLFVALACVLASCFLVLSVVLANPWAALVIVFVLCAIVIELFGFMGIMAIKLSAVPAFILIVAVGIGVEFTVHFTVAFLTCIGNRNRRISMSIEHFFSPIFHGGMSTLLGVFILAFSEFDFIVKYFFYVLSALVIIGLTNGLIFLPVLLSLIGPPAEVIPKDNPDRIATPTPEPSPVCVRPKRNKSKHENLSANNRRIYPSEISLSTITEEPPSWHSSHEIVVQPEVVVQTTTSFPNDSKGEDEDDTDDSDGKEETKTSSTTNTTSSSSKSNKNMVTTKVTATAKVKVEVHTPMPERECNYKHTKRRSESK